MKRPTKLRPSEGGRMWGPVGPSSPAAIPGLTSGDAQGIVTEHDDPRDAAIALRTVSGVDWSDVGRLPSEPISGPTVPPRVLAQVTGTDPELEAERARLVGKRVRLNSGRVVLVEAVTRCALDGCTCGKIWADYDGRKSAITASSVEPIPDEPAKPEVCTFGELAVGEWFLWEGGARGHHNLPKVKTSSIGCRFRLDEGAIPECEIRSTTPVHRIPAPGGAK